MHSMPRRQTIDTPVQGDHAKTGRYLTRVAFNPTRRVDDTSPVEPDRTDISIDVTAQIVQGGRES